MDDFILLPWSAPFAAASAILISMGLFRAASQIGRIWPRRILKTVFVFLMVISGVLFLGSLLNRYIVSRIAHDFPAPGKLVDVGGYRIHILCEGPIGKQTILWISGGYGQGLWLHHLHSSLKNTHRSCLIDRAGTGWSDAGPMPRRPMTINNEFAKALEGASERGPFVLVGHSLGGLQAVNFAAMFPDRVVGVVALDPTPQTVSPEGRRYWATEDNSRARYFAWTSSFGLGHLLPFLNPLNSPEFQSMHKPLEPVMTQLKAFEARPSALLSDPSASYEALGDPYGVIRAPGALGALPILSIVQAGDPGEAKKIEETKTWLPLQTDFEVKNWVTSARIAQQEYPLYSSRGNLKFAPQGAGHLFPVTHAEFTLDTVKEFIANLPTTKQETK